MSASTSASLSASKSASTSASLSASQSASLSASKSASVAASTSASVSSSISTSISNSISASNAAINHPVEYPYQIDKARIDKAISTGYFEDTLMTFVYGSRLIGSGGYYQGITDEIGNYFYPMNGVPSICADVYCEPSFVMTSAKQDLMIMEVVYVAARQIVNKDDYYQFSVYGYSNDNFGVYAGYSGSMIDDKTSGFTEEELVRFVIDGLLNNISYDGEYNYPHDLNVPIRIKWFDPENINVDYIMNAFHH
ncbi:hypothetical protein [Pectobacterium cacticida]|uniref:hypothetical protein n=1 Tax=Pectobacterium cacticida TaxID=69221 RepID=UPI003985D5FF